jgi:hypothetical protein
MFNAQKKQSANSVRSVLSQKLNIADGQASSVFSSEG